MSNIKTFLLENMGTEWTIEEERDGWQLLSQPVGDYTFKVWAKSREPNHQWTAEQVKRLIEANFEMNEEFDELFGDVK